VAETDAAFTRVAHLLAAAGLPGLVSLLPLQGGRNNRAYLLETNDGQRAFLKVYFRHPGDARDRFGAETALLAHAEALGIDRVARVLAADREAGLVILEFIYGRKLAPEEIDAGRVAEALDFYLALNRRSAGLPDASEACFSPEQHLACVRRRVDRLASAARQGEMRADGAAFVADELVPAWRTIEAAILQRAARLPGGAAAVLPRELRRISPSDFGFHNALLTPRGTLAFLDFEYAGMDDPAKLVCDFFCQPEVPVPRGLLPTFLAGVAQASSDDAALGARVRLLFPAYGVKWCCIMLNDFLPMDGARRAFAEAGPASSRLDRQLALARGSLTQYLAVQEMSDEGN